MNNLEKGLYQKLLLWLKENAPENTNIIINSSPIYSVSIVCNGYDSIMGYWCCYHPGHDGQCYDANKQVNFFPR